MGAKAVIKDDIQILDERLQTLKGVISGEEFKELSTQLEEIRKSGLGLSDTKYMGEIAELTQKISKLEFGKLSLTSIKETSKDVKLKSFLDKIEYIRLCIGEGKNVEQVLKAACDYWDSIRESYDEIEISEVEKKISEVSFEQTLRKIKDSKEIDLSEVTNKSNYYFIRDRLQSIVSGNKISEETRLLISSWLGESIDSRSGQIDGKVMEKLVRDKKVWEILAEVENLTIYAQEPLSNREEPEQKALVPTEESEERKQKIKELSEKYGIPLKKFDFSKKQAQDVIYVEEYKVFGKEKYRIISAETAIKINRRSFGDVPKIVAAIFNNGVVEIDKGFHSWKKSLAEVVFPDNLQKIAEEAFIGSGLEKIIIPGNVKTIGKKAFYGSYNLNIIILENGIEYIGKAAFMNTGIDDLTVPGSVRTVDGEAFKNTPLRSLTLEEGIQELGYESFRGTALSTVYIPGSVKDIGESAFYDANLRNVVLNNGIENIYGEAFYNCGLKSVEFPESIRTIYEGAFGGNPINRVLLPKGVGVAKNSFPEHTIVERTQDISISKADEGKRSVDLEKEIESLRSKLESLEKRSSDLEKENASLESEVERLKMENTKYKESLKVFTQSRSSSIGR